MERIDFPRLHIIMLTERKTVTNNKITITYRFNSHYDTNDFFVLEITSGILISI